MSIVTAIIQGVIQGLTEFLPVSSSGHLALYQYFTGQNGEAGALFSLVLHLGTLIAVVMAFWGTIRELIVEFFKTLGQFFTGRLDFRRPNPQQKMIFLLIVSLLPLFLTLIFKDPIREVAQDSNIVIEGLCFLVTGTLLMLADGCMPGHIKAPQMGYLKALGIGLTQAVAPLPGISRSGSTLSVGILMGLERQYAVSFSFIMGIPAVCAALLLDAGEIVNGAMDIPLPVIAVGLAVSALFGLLAIGMVRWLVREQKLRWFGYYTLLLGAVTLILGAYELFAGQPIQNFIMTMLA